MASGGLVYLAGWLVKRFGGVEGASGEVVYEANVHAWMIVMFVMAIVMISLGLYHTRMLLPAVLQLPRLLRLRKHSTNWWKSFLISSRKTYLVLYRLYYSLSFCRRLCDEDRAVVSESG